MTVFTRLLLVVLAMLAPALAGAQPVAVFDRLVEVLNTGDRVRVTAWSGRVVQGEVAALTPDYVALARDGGATERLARADVREISMRRRDGLQNGAAIGFAGVALVTCLGAGSDEGGQCRLGAVILGGLGAGVGMLVDAAISRRVVVFRAAPRPVAIDVGSARNGAGAVAAWQAVSPARALTGATVPTRERLRQSPAPAAARPSRPWTVSMVTGLPSRHTLDDLEETMRDTGFDLDSGGCVFGLCFESTPNPYSIRGRPFRDSWTAGINRRVGNRAGVSVTGGRTLMGWTTGRHRGTGASVEIETAMTHVAPLVTFMPTAGVRFGAGPGLFSTTFARTGLDPQPLDTTRSAGLVADASLTFPRRSRVFVELSAQQRWLGRQSLGPIDVLPDGTAPFPQTRVRVAHWFIGLGAGVRF